MENSDNNQYFTLYDLGCAAALTTLGFELADIDKENPRKALFLFTYSTTLEQAARDYWSDNLAVNPRRFFDDLKMLKSRIYAR
jgi:hypothetical protein